MTLAITQPELPRKPPSPNQSFPIEGERHSVALPRRNEGNRLALNFPRIYGV